MKSFVNLLTVFLAVFVFATTISADERPDIPEEYKAKYKQIEENLLVGLNSDNKGLRLSCAYYLGEMQSQKALLPMMAMLRDNNSEEERILAALALTKIDSEVGLFALKRVGQMDENNRVRKLCCKFYNATIMNERIEESMEEILARLFNSRSTTYGYSLADFAE